MNIKVMINRGLYYLTVTTTAILAGIFVIPALIVLGVFYSLFKIMEKLEGKNYFIGD